MKRMKVAIFVELSKDMGFRQDPKIVKTLKVIRNNSKYWKRFNNLNLNINNNEDIILVNTGGSNAITIELLINMYNKFGIRIFIGFNRSTMLNLVWNQFFSKYPDTYIISPQSTAPSLKFLNNLFRLTPSDDKITKWYTEFVIKEEYKEVIILNQENDVYSDQLCPLIKKDLDLKGLSNNKIWYNINLNNMK